VPLVAEAAVGFDVNELSARCVGGHCASSFTRASDGVKLRRPMVLSTVPVALPRLLDPSVSTDARMRAAYAEGAGVYRILPAAVAVPRGVEELQRLVRWAAEYGVPLVPRGAGSGMPGGNVGHGLVVDLSQGFRWIAPDWSRRTVWTGASVTWAELTAAARPFGLRLPPDPSSGAFATSGGMVATNAAGPRSVRSGSVRSWVEAIELIGADGEPRRGTRGAGTGERFHLSADQRGVIAARFPKTRKNAAGYALDGFAESGDELDLLIGSEGTLAFITAVEWRLEPIPADAAGGAPSRSRRTWRAPPSGSGTCGSSRRPSHTSWP